MVRLSLAITLVLAACTGRGGERGTFAGDAGAFGDGAVAIPGAETLGDTCFGACGSADGRKCSLTSEDCASDLCLVDPSHERINYCTVDCTSRPCPAGYRCEDIEAFGHPEVLRGCVAEPAVCGDGVVQLGEICDGDDPALGRCVDCASWSAVCGDGSVQAPEVCDGNSSEAYCAAGCSAWLLPEFAFTVRRRVASAVDRVEGPSTYFYGTGYEDFEEVSGSLPLSGGADGCGALRVLESNAELTRLEWTYCDADLSGRSVWTFAVPRERVTWSDWDGAIPSQFDATVTLHHPDGARSITWTMAHMQRFEARTYITEELGLTRGDIQFRLEQPDPVQSFSTARAEIDLEIVMRHPVYAAM